MIIPENTSRKIDSLGRITLPKGLRDRMRLVENDELESGTVAQELQKGYMYKDSVVRHSMVSVVQ